VKPSGILALEKQHVSDITKLENNLFISGGWNFKACFAFYE